MQIGLCMIALYPKEKGFGDACSAEMAKPAFFVWMFLCKRSVESAVWYVIQTTAGKEEELAAGLGSVLAGEGCKCCRECFVIRAEWLKRLGGEWRVQVRPLFPGYVFAETDQPEALFLRLKHIPKFARLLGTGEFEFTALEPGEEEFLKRICREGERPGQRWLVRLSEVESESGAIRRIKGPLNAFAHQIERINLHKRYAVVRVMMRHREQTVLFGLAGDDRQGIAGHSLQGGVNRNGLWGAFYDSRGLDGGRYGNVKGSAARGRRI